MNYPATQTYWLEPTDILEIGLRRYTSGSAGWTCAEGWHQAKNIIAQEHGVEREENGRRALYRTSADRPRGDSRWPTECDKGCGYQFTDADAWQNWDARLYRRSDTGQLVGLRDAPPGACWSATWLPESHHQPTSDGIVLIVKLPNGHDWTVDAQASNCTRKGESHNCWCRHGDPRECKVTVDKNGDTCAAGAGSILAGDYHGFLQAGILTAG